MLLKYFTGWRPNNTYIYTVYLKKIMWWVKGPGQSQNKSKTTNVPLLLKDCDQLSQIYKCMTLTSHLFNCHFNCSKGLKNSPHCKKKKKKLGKLKILRQPKQIFEFSPSCFKFIQQKVEKFPKKISWENSKICFSWLTKNFKVAKLFFTVLQWPV